MEDMKLLVSIVHSDDADQLMTALRRGGFSSTKISTTGGFLREGNATILVGTEEANIPRVLEIIKRNCHTRTQYVNPLPPVMEPGELYLPNPVEVQVGGAVIFVLNVERLLRSSAIPRRWADQASSHGAARRRKAPLTRSGGRSALERSQRV
jgi:uncharacterized protein YaaQ